MKTSSEKVKINFVCSGNYYRSRLAEAYFNYISDLLKLNYIADSHGLAIHFADELAEEHGEISPFSREKLEEIGVPTQYYIRDRKSLTSSAIDSSDINIAMDKDEHTPMLKEQFPERESKFKYFEIKDVFDWEPDKTISKTILQVEGIINQIIENGKIEI